MDQKNITFWMRKKDLTHSLLTLLGHGKCDCGKCKCDEGWYGEACQYPTSCNLTRKKSNEMCKNSQDIICSGAGKMSFVGFDCLRSSLCVILCIIVFYFLTKNFIEWVSRDWEITINTKMLDFPLGPFLCTWCAMIQNAYFSSLVYP